MRRRRSAIFLKLVDDLNGLGQEKIVSYLHRQIWGGFPDAKPSPPPEVPLPIDSAVTLAQIVLDMAGDNNPASERFLKFMRGAQVLMRHGYPQMGSVLVLEGIHALLELSGRDLVNFNQNGRDRAEVILRELKTIVGATLNERPQCAAG
jgi:hypothetical protein